MSSRFLTYCFTDSISFLKRAFFLAPHGPSSLRGPGPGVLGSVDSELQRKGADSRQLEANPVSLAPL